MEFCQVMEMCWFFQVSFEVGMYIQYNKTFPRKIERILEQTDKYLTENLLKLNANKTEMLFFTNRINWDQEITFKGKVIKPTHLFVILEYKLIET